MLSRQTAGLRGKSLILNLPGKPKSIRETIDEASHTEECGRGGGINVGVRLHPPPPPPPLCLLRALNGLQVFVSIPACINLLEGPYIETHDAVVKAFRPPAMVRSRKPAAAASAEDEAAAPKPVR